MIRYVESVEGIEPEQLVGFFVDWPNPPSPDTHLRLLHGSDHVVAAVDGETGKVVGLITAVSDGVLSAYIPLLEVLPDYQRQGIGRELVRRMLDRLGNLYMVDLICDPHLEPFYGDFGMRRTHGMSIRNYDRQNGL
jgi:ribosomal protein S18 acetylase RimI-like enzyme